MKPGFLCVFFGKNAGQKNCTKNFQSFSNNFPIFKQIKKLGWKEPSAPFFFNCLYFIGVDGDENLNLIEKIEQFMTTMSQWESVRHDIKGSLVQDSMEAMICVLQQDTLSSA